MFSKGPSADEIAKKQEASAKVEREKIATESAEKSAFDKKQLQDTMQDKQSQRRDFVAGEGVEDDDTARRKFLKGV